MAFLGVPFTLIGMWKVGGVTAPVTIAGPAGAEPRDEFPSLAEYALGLAEGEPRRPEPWWRRETVVRAAMLIFTVIYLVWALLDGNWVTGLLCLALLLWQVLGRRRRGPAGPG